MAKFAWVLVLRRRKRNPVSGGDRFDVPGLFACPLGDGEGSPERFDCVSDVLELVIQVTADACCAHRKPVRLLNFQYSAAFKAAAFSCKLSGLRVHAHETLDRERGRCVERRPTYAKPNCL